MQRETIFFPHTLTLTTWRIDMTRKHFQELVEIIVDNNLNDKTQRDIMSLCKRSNRNFCKVMFMEAIEKLSNKK